MANKTCLIIPSVSAGGIETYVLRFLRFLDTVEHITVLVRSTQKGDLYDDYATTGVKLVFMPLGYMNPSKLMQHYRFYKQEKFDVICDFSADFAGWVMWLAKIAGIPKRITFYRQSTHHFKLTKFRLFYANFLNQLVYKNATKILSNSQAALDFFFDEKKEKDNRFRVVKNGVNIEEFELTDSKQVSRNKLGLDQNKFIIGHTGRFAEAKNHYFLLDVIKQYALHYPKDLFVLVGKDTEKLKPYLRKLEIEEFVQIAGYQKEIPTYLNAFDAFVFPSITEGQPNALIEAMISDLPVACSNIQPILECLPIESQHLTFNPNNVHEAVNVLENLRKDKFKYMFTKHASENFNARKQFLQFKNILETSE